MLYSVLGSGRFLLAVLLASCTGFPTGPATPLSVTLTRSIAPHQPPSFAATGGSGTIEATWATYGGACDDAEATAERSGDLVTIHVRPSASPPPVCIMSAVSYRYVARVSGLAPGRYRVRVVDELRQPVREIGRGAVMVTAGS